MFGNLGIESSMESTVGDGFEELSTVVCNNDSHFIIGPFKYFPSSNKCVEF